MTYEFDVTAGNTPLGTILTTLGDNELREGSHFRVTENGAGAVELVLSADHPKAALIPDDCYVRIRDTTLGSYIAGGFPTGATVKLISRAKDRRELRRFGPGSLGYLRRAGFRNSNFSTHPAATPDVFNREPGMVLWFQQTWGAILTRAIEEGRDMPGNPLGAIVLTFTRGVQTGGAPWTLIDTEGFSTPWGTNFYDLLEAFIRQGLHANMTPSLQIQTWETPPGTDHSGAAFGANVVRFQVGSSPTDLLANIMTDAERVWQSERTSHLMVVGGDGVTVVHVTDAGAPVKKQDVYDYPESSDPLTLQRAGEAELARRALRAIGSLRLPVRLADDPLDGSYLPGPGRPLWKGNTVTVFTGSEQYDISADMKVAALDWRLTNAHGWECTAELGNQFIDREGLAQGHQVSQIIRGTRPRPHSHPSILCPAKPGENLLLGLGAASIKVSSEDVAAGNLRQYACDGDLNTVWDGTDGTGVPEEYWAADLGASKEAMAYRLRTQSPAHTTNYAEAIIVYGSDDPLAWSWLPAGKLSADPAANGWTKVSGYGDASFPVDTGNSHFGNRTFRYWLFRATAGPTGTGTDWDINEVGLFAPDALVGNSRYAARCDHNHRIESLRTAETDTSKRLRPDGSGGVHWVAMAEGLVGWFIVPEFATENDAIDAYNAAGGGVLYWPEGEYTPAGGALNAITAGGRILGDGHAHRDGVTQAGTRINCTSATASLFTIASHAVTIERLALVNTAAATPTAGAGITVSAGGHNRYENLSVSGFFIDIDIQDGEHWAMSSVYLYNSVSHGLKIRHADLPDGGDWSLSDMWVTAAARTAAGADAIRVESGGGGKLTNVKVNADALVKYTNGLGVAVTTGIDTSVLLVSNCSFENVSGHGISITSAGTGRWRWIGINGCQFGLWGNNTGKAISITPTNTDDIENIVIGSNLFNTDGTARSAIQLTNVDNVTLVGNNRAGGFTSLYTESGSTNIVEVGGGASALDDLSDVAIASPVSGQVVRYNGTTWVNAALSASDFPFHDEPLTDGASNLIFADGDVIVVTGVPN